MEPFEFTSNGGGGEALPRRAKRRKPTFYEVIKKDLAIKIDQAILKKACKEIIESILFCLHNAFKGTVYRIGKPPEMVAKRITSGIIDDERKNISWGLPERSDYNPPGRPWIEYRDEQGRPMEAMAWCVERQKSWTAENPKKDIRSVRLQVEGVWEDFHHMEPVLIRKEDLYLGNGPSLEYPKNYEGKTLWENSEYVVVAVIKIHFQPNTIKVGSPEAKFIKRLSRALGTELLSYQLRQQSVEVVHQLAEDKLNSCNILADSLRNAITKSGLIFSLIKLELGSLREQWEDVLLMDSDKKGMKREAVHTLNRTIENMGENTNQLGKDLIDVQNRFLELSLPPEHGENWVRMQVEERWDKLLREKPIDEGQANEVWFAIDKLKRSLYLGKDPEILAKHNRIPEALKNEWVDLIYMNTDHIGIDFLDRVVHILENPSLNLPYQGKCRKSLIHLKTLAYVIGQLEDNINVVLQQVLNGRDDVLNNRSI